MNLKYNDTICAPATSIGAGAVSMIRVSGNESLRIADSIIRCRRGCVSDCAGYCMRYGTIFREDGSVLDDVITAVFRAPNSYTGEDSVEISCHASAFIVSEILALLVKSGARMAGPGEFTRRAFVNGKMDLAQAEAVADVITASSEAAHRVAVNQLRGGYSSELKTLRDKLLEAASMMELELDFSEEEVEFADRKELRSLLELLRSQVSHLASSFRAGNALKNGVPVVIVGAANAGKSTLLNALLGEDRAIVSDIAGTTRDTIEETVTLDGILFRFIDTAGLRDTSDVVERMGIDRSYEAIRKADVVIGVVDGTSVSAAEETNRLRSICNGEQTLIIALNKADSPDFNSREFGDTPVIDVSAREGQGLDRLRLAIVESQAGRFSSGETLVTNLRHYEAFVRSAEDLRACLHGLDSGLSTELLAEELRAAISELGSVTGEITTPDVLQNIFSKFCIGK